MRAWGGLHPPDDEPYRRGVRLGLERGVSRLGDIGGTVHPVGATSHFVAVPAARAEQPVQEFAAFTADLYKALDGEPEES